MIEPQSVLLEGWAGSSRARCWLYRPRDGEEAAESLASAAERGLTVVHRGAGLSYGDAALNEGGAALDTTALGRPVVVDPERGLARADAGATVEDVWKAALPKGWWPAVVPGTMQPTVGGCVAMDVHGKNHYRRGTFGEHVDSVSLLEPGSAARVLLAGRDDTGLERVIGAQGLTGTILDATLRLQRVHSGYVEVSTWTAPSFEAALGGLEERSGAADYAVAWVDCTATGKHAGRAVGSHALDLPRDHRLAGRGFDLRDQVFPERLLGFLPRSWGWRALLPLTWEAGLRALNEVRYRSADVRPQARGFQSYARFHFMLDFLPGWKRVYRPNGFLQYQMFVPSSAARYAFGTAIRLQHERGITSTLAVLKRHRAGRFAAPYALDGYSLALDFPVRPRQAAELGGLCRSFDDLVREVGGRIYAAKDALSRGRLPTHRHPLFSSNLVRRWEGAPYQGFRPGMG